MSLTGESEKCLLSQEMTALQSGESAAGDTHAPVTDANGGKEEEN